VEVVLVWTVWVLFSVVFKHGLFESSLVSSLLGRAVELGLLRKAAAPVFKSARLAAVWSARSSPARQIGMFRRIDGADEAVETVEPIELVDAPE